MPQTPKDPNCVNGYKPLVLPNAASMVGNPICGSDTCVDLLKSTMGNSPTATWVKGAAPDANTPIGTFVATFYNNNGTRFANKSGFSHVGALLGVDDSGITLLDQYRFPHVDTLQSSDYSYGGTRNYNANASNYYIVMVPCK